MDGEQEELEYETLENTIDLDVGELEEGEEPDDPKPSEAGKVDDEREREEPDQPLQEVQKSQFSISGPVKHRDITEEDIQSLYDSLDVDLLDRNVRASALFLRSLTPLSVYEVERFFADFPPERCALLSAETAVVRFKSSFNAAEALIGVTKRLVRVRKADADEDGEVRDSEDEDEAGNLIRNEGGEKVLVVTDPHHKPDDDVVEVDVTSVKVPAGQWRLVVQHVPRDRFVFARLSTGFELRTSMIQPYMKEVSEDHQPEQSRTDYKSKDEFSRKRVRPGLNVFDEKGKELDWDYEHDTRFYENIESDEPSLKKSLPSGPEEFNVDGTKIKSRGRGTKKFVEALLDDSD